ncbi:hypothetical protein [Paenibacillus sp. Leaf72]|uniref:hypothetical protein n=1 Tax=Paenibacillus sp. Leaf72 TaxID=1736234 RepID=UPI0006F8E440|nr:hypothetical protein [Paenibacillus sp. Leaf72]KQN96776.1 hypothetical protein ASF12_22140 [Paenibacillus sp. Leaf72]
MKELPNVTIGSEAIRKTLTALINEFIRVENSETGLEYQVRSNYIRGQIDLLTTMINEKWQVKDTGQSYYEHLNTLVQVYSLMGVWQIDKLQPAAVTGKHKFRWRK